MNTKLRFLLGTIAMSLIVAMIVGFYMTAAEAREGDRQVIEYLREDHIDVAVERIDVTERRLREVREDLYYGHDDQPLSLIEWVNDAELRLQQLEATTRDSASAITAR